MNGKQGKNINASKTEMPYPFKFTIHCASFICPKSVIHQFHHTALPNFVTGVN